MARIDPRRRAGRRGSARAIDPIRARRFAQARVSEIEIGPGLVQDGTGRISADPGDGLQLDPSGKLRIRSKAPLTADSAGELELRLLPSRGLRVEGGRLVLKETEPVADLAAGAALADVISKVNELLAELRRTDRVKE